MTRYKRCNEAVIFCTKLTLESSCDEKVISTLRLCKHTKKMQYRLLKLNLGNKGDIQLCFDNLNLILKFQNVLFSFLRRYLSGFCDKTIVVEPKVKSVV